ncbi:hypothetical protein KTR66_04655 [Roseococcus sp. SDR]|uniref:hypothetical protein n=1 Tax=Roseococcus sp. SDR TaxID=2835532 RepID=UPI001BD0662C|nr:hypothetical protein [Roseococcus sp. SDR]MBS7789270.1 hypothetical protein [Roseococcus sp. SDR]MBV1844584.1 hypothetical protein [Roseococcus sp. SDR]
MHIRTLKQAATPGGGIVPAGTILDLPEAEAAPMLKAGDAELLNEPQATEEASASEGQGEGGEAEEGQNADGAE